MKNIIGLSGRAGSGKDSMFGMLQARNPKFKRFSLADALKVELNPHFQHHFGIDIFNCTREQKELVRPLLVAHAKVRRTLSSGTHYSAIITPQINEFLTQDPENVAIVTDIRYAEYVNDELYWIKALGGSVVHLRLVLPYNKNIPYVNDDEMRNDPVVRKNCDLSIGWPKVESLSIDNVRIARCVQKIEHFIKN